MKIITVTGYKGGVGKSTTAVHVATFFSELGKTILVDDDLNRTALSWAERGSNSVSFPFSVVSEKQAMKSIGGNDYVVIDTPARLIILKIGIDDKLTSEYSGKNFNYPNLLE